MIIGAAIYFSTPPSGPMDQHTAGFWLGVVGAMIGSAMTFFGQWLQHHWQTGQARKLDDKRKAILRDLMAHPGPTGWKGMEGMMQAIGASREETARLLIEMDARGNAQAGGNDVWGYIEDIKGS